MPTTQSKPKKIVRMTKTMFNHLDMHIKVAKTKGDKTSSSKIIRELLADYLVEHGCNRYTVVDGKTVDLYEVKK